MASAPTPAPFPAERLLPDLARSHIGAALDPRTISAISSASASASSSSSPSPKSRPRAAHPPTMAPSPSFSDNPKAYNNLASAYAKRNGTASTAGTAGTSRTALGSDEALQQAYAARHLRQRMPSHTGMPQRPVEPLQSRVFGLTADLREPSSATAANSPALDDATRMARLLNEQRPNFSVEVFASSFDHRGYPVLSGRAATVRGVVRMPATKGCDVMMTISAHTTSGSPAAVWQGTALAPWSTGGEKTVFEIKDRLVANYDLVRPRAAYAPKNEEMMEPPQISKDDLVLPIPFQVQLPLGKSTRFIDGEMQAVPVSLPPSFEISSKHAAQEKRDIRLATKGKAKGLMAKELLEKGFEKVYRIGCYYQVTWTLIRPSNDKSKKSSTKSAKDSAEGDSLTLPFIFLGEPTTMAPHPPTLPSTISPDVFMEQNTTLGDQWAVHRSQAKWAGALLKASRKTVDMELHIPSPPVLQAPSVLPIMVVLRPTDPTLLSQIRTRAPSETSTAPGSPAVTQVDDPIEMVSSPVVSSSGSTVASPPPPSQQQRDTDTESIRTTRSIMSKFMKPSSSFARLPGSSSRKGGSSLFGSRRPNTAPSSGSSETGLSDAMTDRTFVAAGAIPDLVSLVCVSLIQTTFSSNDNVNDGPEHRRKLLSVADLEEVDVHALLLNSDSSGSQPGSRPGSSRSPEEMSQINEAAVAAKAAGVRVLVGTLKVAGTTPPSFRCHGLEVKYALKVDLLPANRYSSGDGVEKALRNLGIGGRSRGFSDGMSTTASMHTQTQFTSLSGDGSSPPTTPPNVMSPSLFGSRSPGMDMQGPASRAFTRPVGSRNASPLSGSGSQSNNVQNVGMAISTSDESAVPADMAEAQEMLSPQLEHASRAAVAPPYPHAYPQQTVAGGRATPSVYGSGMSSTASMRTGWGSGHSISEASQMQSSIYMSEWGRDRKTVSKINKTIGEMWLDIRLVRGYNAY